MSKKVNRKKLRKKGIGLINNSVTVLIPSVINNTILIESTLVVLLATLGDPTPDNIYLYRLLLCTLLLSIAFGVLCTSIISIDFYNLGNKILEKAKKENREDSHEAENPTRTGKLPYRMTKWTFVSCLILFLISLVLLVIYAWQI
ncbi:hypothetical protein [Winogradskyella thalassocola]|uniref:DUF3899 domain-containing protein n=1 Tax=Winogradskyella thalassocola TaxID=262004 RepID=A0A1G8FIZ7_9FLAO|nr:hypothetical protein [Winogradskyella thalassocola]SDH82100.1 hypothetical protein SAMN04489796_104268 [Winogradskyella thalassocola]